MKTLFKYLEENGIVLLRHNSKYNIRSIEEVILCQSKYPFVKEDLKFYIKNFYNELSKNKLGIEYPGLGKLRCILSREMFGCLYSLKVYRTQKNKPLKKLPKKDFSNLERDIYNFIYSKKTVSKKSLEYFFDALTQKSKKDIEIALRKLQKDFWIVKVGQDNEEGSLWSVAWKYDSRLTKKILKMPRKVAINKIIFNIIKSSNGITRAQVKKLLKNFASDEEIDQTINTLILNSSIQFHKTLVVNGKKALIVIKK